MKKTGKVRRVVLGVGYPWYFRSIGALQTDSVRLASRPGLGMSSVPIKLMGGNWNKVRLVLEILK